MCFGSGSPEQPFNGYDTVGGTGQSGVAIWTEVDRRLQEQRERAARGEISPQQLAEYEAVVLPQYGQMTDWLKRDPAAATELRETQRQGRVSLGKIGIDKAFQAYDPAYYEGYRKQYQDYYQPEVDRQFTDTRSKLTAALAGRGIGASTVSAAKQADLVRQRGDAVTDIANRAQDASQKLRAGVENSKSNLYNLNEASADPAAINARAVGEASAVQAQPTYDPLGQLFSSALAPFANYSVAQANSPTRSYRGSTASGAGSGRIVR